MANKKKTKVAQKPQEKQQEKQPVNEKYKDRIFKSLFGNPEHKDWTLALYNAVNNSQYTNPNDIQFNTIDDALFVGLQNDVSFIFMFELNLWEHQSTFDPNMPVRFLRHYAQVLEKHIVLSHYNPFSTKLQRLPRPRFVCFYNGTKKQPEQVTLKLSDAFGISSEESDIEVKVTMININYGKNQKLLEACKPLKEYAWLVETIRQHQKEKNNLEVAIDLTIDEMPKDFVIRNFIIGNRAEVKKMLLTEWNEQEMLQRDRDEVRMDERQRIAVDMLKSKRFSRADVVQFSKLSEDVVDSIEKSLALGLA